jgi:hypothetical protein
MAEKHQEGYIPNLIVGFHRGMWSNIKWVTLQHTYIIASSHLSHLKCGIFKQYLIYELKFSANTALESGNVLSLKKK